MDCCPRKFGVYMDKPRLLLCRPEGRLTREVVRDVFSCMSCATMPGCDGMHRFHDLRHVTGIDIQFDDMNALVREEVFARRDKPTIKACYLVANPVVYGLVSMYRGLIAGRGVDVYVSKDLHEIAGELGVSPDQLDLSGSRSSPDLTA